MGRAFAFPLVARARVRPSGRRGGARRGGRGVRSVGGTKGLLTGHPVIGSRAGPLPLLRDSLSSMEAEGGHPGSARAELPGCGIAGRREGSQDTELDRLLGVDRRGEACRQQRAREEQRQKKSCRHGLLPGSGFLAAEVAGCHNPGPRQRAAPGNSTCSATLAALVDRGHGTAVTGTAAGESPRPGGRRAVPVARGDAPGDTRDPPASIAVPARPGRRGCAGSFAPGRHPW